ncbi:MAG TPA: glutathione synthase, partial [Gammaproteobacteria bacterium]|nr:glutathione synthase [Gammaproteobacteria bacterium]
MVTQLPATDRHSPRLAVIMDPIEAIHPEKDTSLALLLEGQSRGYELVYLPPAAIAAESGRARGRGRLIRVRDSATHWFEAGAHWEGPLESCDLILMRKDPPFDQEYVYLTYLLELAERAGARVVNAPRALRDCNEKASLLRFPQFAPPTIVARDLPSLREFREREGRIVLKPLDGMGGRGVFVLGAEDPNLAAVFEMLSRGGREHIMAQRYLPEISDGDKRVLLVAGRPVPFMLARVPAEAGGRGNLAAGARGEPRPLGAREREIAEAVGPILAREGLLFVGLDIIGGRLTEINVTSPTCVRELDHAFDLNIA